MTETTAAKSPRARAGRAVVTDPKTCPVMMRCTPAELAELKAMAADAGMSVGAFLRAIAFGSPGPRAVRRPSLEREASGRILAAIGKLGSNVNQLARVANTNWEMAATAILGRIEEHVQAMRSALMAALGRGD